MLYRRVFSTHHGSVFDIAVISLIVILSLFYGITTFFKIFECNPHAKMFDASLPGHCYDIGKILKASGAFNTVSDYIILLLPCHAVHKLQMKKKKKLLVILVFTFGLWYALTITLAGLFPAKFSLQCTCLCHSWICGSIAEKLQQRYLVGPAHYSLMGVCFNH
jgi:hypothetical protein